MQIVHTPPSRMCQQFVRRSLAVYQMDQILLTALSELCLTFDEYSRPKKKFRRNSPVCDGVSLVAASPFSFSFFAFRLSFLLALLVSSARCPELPGFELVE